MRIILLRHGDAVNTKGKFHGMIDNPLTDTGRKEVGDLADHLKQYNMKMIYTSPLSRTRESASIISRKLGIPVQPNNGLLPLDLGNFDGKAIDPNLDKVRDYFRNPNKQFPNGESTNQWANRYISFLNPKLFDKSPDTIGFMTHGRNIILSEADRELGNNPNFNKSRLIDNKQSTEHGGYAVITPDSFDIKTPKAVASGQS